jgi:hypothetical protein
MNSIDDLNMIVMQQMKNIHDEYDKNTIPRNPLYHYTDFKGLKGILENRELWFSHYRFLNDPTEIVISYYSIQEKLKSFIMQSSQKKLFIAFKNIYPISIERNQVYIFSFCEMPDYLPAWRWYGDNGSGYSIGFRSSYFDTDEKHDSKISVVSIKVGYSVKEFSLLIEKFFMIAENAYNNLYLPKNISVNKIDEALGSILAYQLIPLMPGLKHQDYIHEKEHRLYVLEFKGNNGIAHPSEIPPERKFFTAREPKVSSPFTSENELNIPRLKSEKFVHEDKCEIWIGPRCDFNRAKEEISKILQMSGYDIKNIQIFKSDRPYRG